MIIYYRLLYSDENCSNLIEQRCKLLICFKDEINFNTKLDVDKNNDLYGRELVFLTKAKANYIYFLSRTDFWYRNRIL